MALNKLTYRILLVFTGFLLIAIVSGFLLQNYFKEKIKELFISEINKQLITEVRVDKVKFSIIKDFPYASVRFYNVGLKEAIKRKSNKDLLTADVISLRFSIMDIFSDQFRVNSLMISKATANLVEYPDGSDNYHFWKSTAKKSGGKFEIDLEKVLLLETSISYSNTANQQAYSVFTPESSLSGSFTEELFTLAARGDVVINEMTMGGTRFLAGRKAVLDARIKVDSRLKSYEILKGDLRLNELGLSISGQIREYPENRQIDITVLSSDASLEELITIIPANYLKSIQDYRFKGDTKLTLVMKGIHGNGKLPAIKASLSLEEGKIGRSRSSVSLENVHGTLDYSAGQDGTNEVLVIRDMSARLRNGTISGSLQMKGLSRSTVTGSINAKIDLEDVMELLKLDTLRSLKGSLHVNGQFDGILADIKQPSTDDLANCRISGTARISEGELGIKGFQNLARNIDGTIAFENNNARLNQLYLKYGKSDFNIVGSAGNVIGWLLVKNQKLLLQGSVNSESTDWNDISSANPSGGEYKLELPGDIDLQNLKLNIRNFKFRKFSAKNITASLRMNNRILVANNILMQSMNGVVSGQGSLNASNSNHLLIQCKASINKVNLKRLFAEFGNFGNSDLTSENLDGSVTANVIYASRMFPNLEMDLESVKAHADIRVDNGQLVNYEPMKGLSKFLNVEDLADIRFETLHNQIDIANRIIYIPDMNIKSSAIDLSLMGTHTFSNEVNYHFSIALADLIAAKFQRKNPGFKKQTDFGPVEDDGRGKTQILVSLTGTVDDPVFAYDRKAAAEKINKELRIQKVELKEAFKKEFGSLSGDTLRKSQKAKEKEMQKKQEEGKFVIDWDDDKRIE
jgi:hypothetical protein